MFFRRPPFDDVNFKGAFSVDAEQAMRSNVQFHFLEGFFREVPVHSKS